MSDSSEPAGVTEDASKREASASAEAPRAPRGERRNWLVLMRRILWVGVLIALAAVAFGYLRPRPATVTENEVRFPLPPFTLTDSRGMPFGLEQLRGKVWVADFVFTTCPTVCPKLTQRMVELQQKTQSRGDAFHLVTFTVDPENDTPEVLARYAAANGAVPDRWTFLTGPLKEIETTVVNGFKVAMGRTDPGGGLMSIFHGERLVLVDREGTIRGYYHADDEGMAKLLRDLDAMFATS
ncbi:SCO family protein [Chondromyces apiculatus]|uniref:Cytochrome oxidase biogenesis protein Sco1/SenC/PrrC, putative copper metallochaperone n=1 Tax=Chondromyces apiculatus DSM 436 TaxID=1192034 RepID=A0A017TF08_9BACT|nr:SCO family protein [Chondromyces apiculatus]EYF07405.1 Cytochrome oxidase biogenesis protein Sco1/SenC/PrrC, putative copper metallochaperone [Chondromyces apiculatus DSM 436]